MYLQRSKLHKVKQKYAKMQACAKLKKELHNEAIFFETAQLIYYTPLRIEQRV